LNGGAVAATPETISTSVKYWSSRLSSRTSPISARTWHQWSETTDYFARRQESAQPVREEDRLGDALCNKLPVTGEKLLVEPGDSCDLRRR